MTVLLRYAQFFLMYTGPAGDLFCPLVLQHTTNRYIVSRAKHSVLCMYHSVLSVPLAASARHAARHSLSGLQRVGQVFLAGVRPDSFILKE